MPAQQAERHSPISKMSPKNPYSLILNLPDDVHNPDYYQLLGIARFATDREMIRNAAMDQNRKLMMWQNNDEYYPIVKRLMQEIATALAVLTTEDMRNVYDSELQARISIKDRASFGLDPGLPEEEVILEFDQVAADEDVILEFDQVSADEQSAGNFDAVFLRLVWGIPIVAVMFILLPPVWAAVLTILGAFPYMIGIKRTLSGLTSIAERTGRALSPAEFRARKHLARAKRHIRSGDLLFALEDLEDLLFHLPETSETEAALEELDDLIALYRNSPIGERAERLLLFYRIHSSS